VEKARGRRIGQILVERGWISNDQLLRAIQNQAAVGGRLGTCLLELDLLPEDLLLRALAEQRGVPAASAEDLKGVPPEVHQLLPPKVAKRCGAVPFRLDGNLLLVAMVDVDNLASQDELAFVSGKRIRVHVANEARVYDAIQRYYGEECPARFQHLLDRMTRSRATAERAAAAPARPPVAAVRPVAARVPAPAAVGGAPHAAPAAGEAPPPAAARPRISSIPLAPDERQRLRRATTPTTPTSQAAAARAPLSTAPAPPAPSLADVEARLVSPADREDVAAALLDFLAPRFARVALFIVRRDEVAGWVGRGSHLDLGRLRDFRAALDQPSIFLNLARGGTFYLGPLPPMPVHQALAACWGGQLPAECLLLPIRLRERLVTLVYADRGGAGLRGVDLAQLQQLAAKAAIAFELCIMRGKLRKA
jgi:hypothetical protein